MAHYLVKYKNNSYLNRDLAKAAYGVGDAGLLMLIDDGVLEQTRILDCCVYGKGRFEAPLKNPRAVDAAVYQDLDAQLAALCHAPTGKNAGGKIDYHITVSNTRLYRLGSKDFVRMMDVCDPMKYRLFDEFPSVRYLGKKYIAINAATEKSTYIVR